MSYTDDEIKKFVSDIVTDLVAVEILFRAAFETISMKIDHFYRNFPEKSNVIPFKQ